MIAAAYQAATAVQHPLQAFPFVAATNIYFCVCVCVCPCVRVSAHVCAETRNRFVCYGICVLSMHATSSVASHREAERHSPFVTWTIYHTCITPSFKLLSSLLFDSHGTTAVAHHALLFVTGTDGASVCACVMLPVDVGNRNEHVVQLIIRCSAGGRTR